MTARCSGFDGGGRISLTSGKDDGWDAMDGKEDFMVIQQRKRRWGQNQHHGRFLGELRPSPAAEGLPASQQRRLSECFAAVFPGEEGQRNRG